LGSMLSCKNQCYGLALKEVEVTVEHIQPERMYITQATGMYEDPCSACGIPFQDVEQFVGRSPIKIAH